MKAYGTFDFSANISFSNFMNSESTNLHLWIQKIDGDIVAKQVDDQAASPSSYQNTSATILYRETLTQDANF